MTLDEAYTEAMNGARVTHDAMNGAYLEHTFARGYLRVFANDSHCEFVPHDLDKDAEWYEFGFGVDHSDGDADKLARAVANKASKWGVPVIDAVVPVRDVWGLPKV